MIRMEIKENGTWLDTERGNGYMESVTGKYADYD